MTRLLTLLTLIVGMSLAGQFGEHLYFGDLVYKSFKGQLPAEQITMPIALMASHGACDYFFSEGALGGSMSEQVLVNGLFAWVGYLIVDDNKRDEYAYVLFWSMLPDIIDKGLGKSYFHNYAQNPVISLTGQQEVELLGLELISFKYIF